MKLLEVIVTSLDEAQAAEDGGADRLELVRDLDQEGLTPPLWLAAKVTAQAGIPVRIMLRESPTFNLQGDRELANLKQYAEEVAQLPADGLVLGFLSNGLIDTLATQSVLDAAPAKRATFHRAIEGVANSGLALHVLSQFGQIDRVLAGGGSGTWADRRTALEGLQRAAGSLIRVIAGGGLDERGIASLAESPLLNEFHVGRAAREAGAHVCSQRVARLRRLLNEAA
jgi:copper homeostasis protein